MTDDWCSPVYSDSKHWEDISFINYLVTQWLHMNTEDIGVGDRGEEKLFFFPDRKSNKAEAREREDQTQPAGEKTLSVTL